MKTFLGKNSIIVVLYKYVMNSLWACMQSSLNIILLHF